MWCDELCSFKMTPEDSKVGPLLIQSQSLILRAKKTIEIWSDIPQAIELVNGRGGRISLFSSDSRAPVALMVIY